MLMPPERYDEEPRILARVRRGERIDPYETIRRRKDGTLLDISLTVSPIVNLHGEVIGASKIARDITQWKQAAALAALDHEAAARLHEVGKLCVRAGSLRRTSRSSTRLCGLAERTESPVVRREIRRTEAHGAPGFDAPFLGFSPPCSATKRPPAEPRLYRRACRRRSITNSGSFAGPALTVLLVRCPRAPVDTTR